MNIKEIKQKRGFSKLKDGKYLNIDEFPDLNKKIKHDISIIVDRIPINLILGIDWPIV